MKESFERYKISECSTNEKSENHDISEGTFRLRFALAGTLFLLVILFDMSGKKLAGISTEQLFKAISTDYETVVETWLEVIKLQTK